MPYQSVDEILAQKKEIKKRLLRKLKIEKSSELPLFSIILDKNLSKDRLKLFKLFDEATTNLNAMFVYISEEKIVGVKNVSFLEYGLLNRELALEGSDFVICLDNNCDVEEIFMQGCIPISKKREELENYDAQSESGNSFVYENENVFALFEACVRAIECYKFSWDFKHLVRSAMKISEGEGF